MWVLAASGGVVGFEVFTPVVMKSFIFWDITPCSLLKVNRRFGGKCHLRLQGRRISQARALLAICFTLVSGLAYSSTLKMEATCYSETSVDSEDEGDMLLRNMG
jgi:hypothetical protein